MSIWCSLLPHKRGFLGGATWVWHSGSQFIFRILKIWRKKTLYSQKYEEKKLHPIIAGLTFSGHLTAARLLKQKLYSGPFCIIKCCFSSFNSPMSSSFISLKKFKNWFPTIVTDMFALCGKGYEKLLLMEEVYRIPSSQVQKSSLHMSWKKPAMLCVFIEKSSSPPTIFCWL
jgi:hypothetical protein